jgi:hypothetical protein
MTLLDINEKINKLTFQRKALIRQMLADKYRKQSAVAKKAGIHPQRINNWINASSELKPKEVERFIEALNS